MLLLLLFGSLLIRCCLSIESEFARPYYIQSQYILPNDVQIKNCVSSFIDNNKLERCFDCYPGLSKSFDKSECFIALIQNCIWASPDTGTCMECSCGYVLNFEMNECIRSSNEGCYRLDTSGEICIQAKIGYTLTYTINADVITSSKIIVDNGLFCGWRLESEAVGSCTKCHPGYFKDAVLPACRRFPLKLENDHAFWVNTLFTSTTTNSDLISAIEFIPGWTSFTAKTNAGVYTNPIEHCLTYNRTIDQFDGVPRCEGCELGFIPTQNLLTCVPGHFLCKYADNTTRKCSECIDKDHYWVNEELDICVSREHMFDNCVTREIEGEECITCSKTSPPSQLVDSKCIPISDCTTSDGTSACIECNPNLALLTGTCIFLENCSIAASAVSCTACMPGFYENSTGGCSQKPRNCITVNVTIPTQCDTCDVGFHLNPLNFQCYTTIPYCDDYEYVGDENYCRRCETMYVPDRISRQTCLLHNLEFHEVCSQTDGQGVCLQCKSLYFTPSCQRLTNYQRCLLSNGINNICIQCYPDSVLNPSEVCVEAPPECLRTDGTIGCQQCQPGFYVNLSLVCERIPHCISSDGVSNVCFACDRLFVLRVDTCILPPTNCAFVSELDVTQCQQCEIGFRLEFGACIQIDNCEISNGIGECLRCMPNFYFNDTTNQCLPFERAPSLRPPQFCSVFKKQNASAVFGSPVLPDFGVCYACEGGRILILVVGAQPTQTCIPSANLREFVYGCLFYALTDGVCAICSPGFSLTLTGTCVEIPNSKLCLYSEGRLLSNGCLACIPGALHDPTASSCSIPIENCIDYSIPCPNCNLGFFLESGVCVLQGNEQCSSFFGSSLDCATCYPDFDYLLNGICLWNPHTRNCTPPGSLCTNCDAGFLLVFDSDDNPTCIPMPASMPDPQCKTYISSGSCLLCEGNYVLSFPQNNLIYRQCAMRHPECNNSDGVNCTACNVNWFPDSTFSTTGCREIPNCTNSSTEGCIQCSIASGYYVNPSNPFECLKLENCRTTRNGIQQICNECEPLFAFDFELLQCTPIDPNCRDGGGTSNDCTTCHQLYSLNPTTKQCERISLPNCLELNHATNECLLCASGFSLNSAFQCTRIENCKESAGLLDSPCLSCLDYFFLQTDGKCGAPDPRIPFCLRYDAGQQCIECETAFFLTTASNSCSPRSSGRDDACILYKRTQNACESCQVKPVGGVLVRDPFNPRFGFCNPVVIPLCGRYQQNSHRCRDCNQNDTQLQGWLTQNQTFCRDVDSLSCLTMDERGNYCKSCDEEINFPFVDDEQHICREICTGINEMWLGNAGCQARTTIIVNCETHHPGKDECLQCKETFYLSDDKLTCNSINIPNCLSNGVDRSNKCVRCNPRYIISSDNSQCTEITEHPPIDNCNSYIDNTFLCNICNKYYYKSPNQMECLPGTVGLIGCEEFSLNSNRCMVCLETHTPSLDGGCSLPDIESTNCLVSINAVDNSQCFLCNIGYIAQEGARTCIKDEFNFIGCRLVSLQNGNAFLTCSACFEELFFFHAGVCIPLARLSTCSIEGCIEYSSILYDSARCSKCVESILGSEAKFVENDGKCDFVPASDSLATQALQLLSQLLRLFF